MSLDNGSLAELVCSRAGCGAVAQYRIDWRNPRIHPEDRRKTWLACTAHRDFLRGYLETRNFPVWVDLATPTAALEAE